MVKNVVCLMEKPGITSFFVKKYYRHLSEKLHNAVAPGRDT
jgi:hypothetical protein